MCLRPDQEPVAEDIEDNPENAPEVGLVLEMREEARRRAVEENVRGLREQIARNNAALAAFMAAIRGRVARQAQQAAENGPDQNEVGAVERNDGEEEIEEEEEEQGEEQREEQNQEEQQVEEEEEEETAV
ncbi:unnamed protein product [Caenorhabditis brenneri]